MRDQLFEEVLRVLGDRGRLTVKAPVFTPEGRQVQLEWIRTDFAGERVVLANNLDEGLRKILLLEEDYGPTPQNPSS